MSKINFSHSDDNQTGNNMEENTINRENTPLLSDAAAKSLGGQTISLAGSVVLISNNIMGPAVVATPLVYQQAGWVPTTLLLIISFFCSSFAATMLCEAMQRIPGNHNFQKRFECATVVGHYFGRKGYIIGQLLVNICIQALNIASIVIASQVMDDFIMFVFGHSYAVRFIPPFKTISISESTDKLFDGEQWVLSLGYALSLIICLPFGFLNLGDNMWFQWFSFIATIGTMTEFIIQFLLMHPVYDWCPAFGNGLQGQALVLGVIVFGWAFVITIPSWVNEKQHSVNVNKAVWGSSVLNLIIKLLFGYLAAIVYKNPSQNANILNVMTSSTTGYFKTVTRITVYIFNIGAIIPGIPVYSILVRYNLLTGKLCEPFAAFIISVVLPWFVSALFYHGSGFVDVINWSAIIFQGFVNFSLPVLLYYVAVKRYPFWRYEKTPLFKQTGNSNGDDEGNDSDNNINNNNFNDNEDVAQPIVKEKNETPDLSVSINVAETDILEASETNEPGEEQSIKIISSESRETESEKLETEVSSGENNGQGNSHKNKQQISSNTEPVNINTTSSNTTDLLHCHHDLYSNYVNAVPKEAPLPAPHICAMVVLVVMTVLTIATLALDIGFLISGIDLI